MEGTACPVCFIEFSATQLESHVNTHFSSPPPPTQPRELKRRRISEESPLRRSSNEKTSEESLPCPIPGCQFFVSQSEWDEHIALHELQEEMV